MVNEIQLNNINFDACTCIKDKYNRIVDGVNHGRAIYHDPVNKLYYKVFHAEYCRVNNFRKAIETNFFEGLAPALISLIMDEVDNVIDNTKFPRTLDQVTTEPALQNLRQQLEESGDVGIKLVEDIDNMKFIRASELKNQYLQKVKNIDYT